MKKDESKTKEQLIDELVEMRRRIAELEALETEWRETEKALRESEEGCWDLLENANDLIQSVAPDGRFLYVNRTWREALGYSQEEIASLSLFDIIHPDSQAHCVQVFQRVLSGEEADRVEAVFVAKDGREILVEGNANCKLVEGKPAYTRGIFRDVTQRKRAQEAVRESERRYRLLAENASDIIWTMDKNLQLTYISPSIERHSGYTPEEMMGRTLEQSYTPASVEAIMKAFEEEMSLEKTGVKGQPTSRVLELEAYNKDGSTDWIETHVTVLRDQDGNITGIVGVTRKITERKRAEEILRAAQQYARSLIDSSLDMIISVDKDRGIVEFNVAAQNTFGYSKAEVLGKQVEILYADPAEGLNVHEAVLKTGQFTGEIVNKRKNGETFSSYLAASAMEDENGKFLGFMGISRDITGRRMMEERLKEYSENLERMVQDRTRELEDAQEKLIRAEKLAAIGELAGGLGHELRSPLGAIKFSADFLKTKLGDTADEKVRKHLNLLEKQVDACDKTVADVLDFSRLGKLNIEEVDINQVIQEVVQASTLPRNVDVFTSLADSLSPVIADAGQMGRVLSNLVTNAIQAMPHGGRLSLSTVQRGRFVEVRVADTGVGVPEEKLDKIFEPLFTTKTKGIGLGLAIVKTLVDRQNGTVEVESQVEKGTTFTVKLPIADGEVRSHE